MKMIDNSNSMNANANIKINVAISQKNAAEVTTSVKSSNSHSSEMKKTIKSKIHS